MIPIQMCSTPTGLLQKLLQVRVSRVPPVSLQHPTRGSDILSSLRVRFPLLYLQAGVPWGAWLYRQSAIIVFFDNHAL